MRYFSDENLNSLALKLRRYAEDQADVENTVYWKILRNKVIISICKNMPTTLEDFSAKKVIIGNTKLKKHGKDILSIIHKHREVSDSISEASTNCAKNVNDGRNAMTEKHLLIERAKMYLKLLQDGIHPVTGAPLPQGFMDEKMERCFTFISEVLDNYVELSTKPQQPLKTPQKYSEKKPYYLLPEQAALFEYSNTPLL